MLGRAILQKLMGGFVGLSLVVSPLAGEAGSLFHATTRAAAKKIMQKGFSIRMMNPKARFGKGAYLSRSKQVAVHERPTADAVVKFNESKLLGKSTVNTKTMSRNELKQFSHDRDLRGNIHKGIPGGDLAHKMGGQAGRKDKVIMYPSARAKGTNVFIPRKVYSEHPHIVKPDSVHFIGNNR